MTRLPTAGTDQSWSTVDRITELHAGAFDESL